MTTVLDPKLLEILACPDDKGPLYYIVDENMLYNPRLKRAYEVREGIPVMLPDEAESVSEADAASLDARIASGELQPTFTPRA